MKILRNVTDFDPGSSTPQGAVGLGTIISAGDLTGTHGVPIVGGIGGVTVSGTPSAGEALVATSSSAAAWSAVLTNPMTTAADLIVGDTGGTPIRLAKGSDGQVLTVDPTTHLLVWANSAAGFANPMTTEGDMIYQTSGSPARLAVGGANALLHGGTDPTYSAVLPADLDVSADNTTANATTGHHGLLLKLGGGTTNFLRADGTWNAPSGGGGSLDVTDGSTTVTSVTEIDFTAGATVSDLGGGTAGVAITGGGGGSTDAPDGKPYNFTPNPSPATVDDEFSDLTSSQSGPINGLNAKWSKHNLGTSAWLALDDTKAPGCLLIAMPDGEAADQSVYQTTPAGDFTIAARWSMNMNTNARQMWALFALDSSGDGIGVSFDYDNSEISMREITGWQQSAGIDTGIIDSTVAAYLNGYYMTGGPVTAYLRKASGIYYGSISLGDRIMQPALLETSATPTAFTNAYVGFGRIYTSGSPANVALDYFRQTA